MLGAWGGPRSDAIVGGGPTGGCGALAAGGTRGVANTGSSLLRGPLDALKERLN